MNTVAALLVVTLSHGGHCYGGGACTIEVGWSADVDVSPAVLNWGLTYADQVVADGQLALDGRGAPACLSIELPQVRAISEMTWTYRVVRKADGHVIEEGRRALTAYPQEVPAELVERLNRLRVLVLDTDPGVGKLLERLGVRHRVVASSVDLELREGDLIVVGPGRLDATAASTDAVFRAASRGAGVLALVQSSGARVGGFDLVRRTGGPSAEWRLDHPALARLPEASWRGWLGPAEQEIAAMAIPPQEAALEIAFWTPSAAGRSPGPLEAVIVEKRVGRGRIVLCQAPASADPQDPRTAAFIMAALDDLRVKDRPTPPRAERLAAAKPAAGTQPARENTIEVGDE